MRRSRFFEKRLRTHGDWTIGHMEGHAVGQTDIWTDPPFKMRRPIMILKLTPRPSVHSLTQKQTCKHTHTHIWELMLSKVRVNVKLDRCSSSNFYILTHTQEKILTKKHTKTYKKHFPCSCERWWTRGKVPGNRASLALVCAYKRTNMHTRDYSICLALPCQRKKND